MNIRANNASILFKHLFLTEAELACWQWELWDDLLRACLEPHLDDCVLLRYTLVNQYYCSNDIKQLEWLLTRTASHHIPILNLDQQLLQYSLRRRRTAFCPP